MLDSVMLGDNSLKRAPFADVAREGELGAVESGLGFCECM